MWTRKKKDNVKNVKVIHYANMEYKKYFCKIAEVFIVNTGNIKYL
jgi:hypothetical protein